jgi:uncharacterized protein Usg
MQRYKKFRAEHPYAGARVCLSWAKDANKVDRPEGFNVRGDSFVVDGFDIAISYEYDMSPDFSYLGKFTDSWEPDAIQNPEAWTSRGNRNPSYLAYFVPAITETEHFDGLRKMGMGRSDARNMARKYVLQDMDQARDFTSYVVKVTASKEEVELGTDYLGGIDDEDYIADAVVEHGMIDNAISEAREKLAKLTASKV